MIERSMAIRGSARPFLVTLHHSPRGQEGRVIHFSQDGFAVAMLFSSAGTLRGLLRARVLELRAWTGDSATNSATAPGVIATCSARSPSVLDFGCGFQPSLSSGTRSRTRGGHRLLFQFLQETIDEWHCCLRSTEPSYEILEPGTRNQEPSMLYRLRRSGGIIGRIFRDSGFGIRDSGFGIRDSGFGPELGLARRIGGVMSSVSLDARALLLQKVLVTLPERSVEWPGA